MIKRIFFNFLKEVKIGWRGNYFLLTVGIAIFYIVFIQFLLPGFINQNTNVYIFTEIDFEIDYKDIQIEEFENVFFVNNLDELHSKLDRNRESFGIYISGTESNPKVELFIQGNEDEALKEVYKISILNSFGILSENNFNKIYLNSEISSPIKMNYYMIPILLLTEAVMVGIVFVFTMIFTEKNEGTIYAYSITPGRIFEYLLGKVLYLIFLGLIFTSVFCLPLFGFRVNYLELFLVIALGSFFSTSVSLIFASFYDNISQSLFSMLALNLVLIVPMFSYLIPSFNPPIMRIIPTYGILFNLRNILFNGYGDLIYSDLLLILLEGIVFFLISSVVYNRMIKKK